jgi:hypothetical protein
MTKEHRIIYEAIGDVPTVYVSDWDAKLHRMYEGLNERWFEGKLPRISDSFVCEFCEMPNGNTGICVTEEWATKWSTEDCQVRPGIRINPGLKCSPEHVEIALIHEMVHASGILGHKDDFWNAVGELTRVGAHRGLL